MFLKKPIRSPNSARKKSQHRQEIPENPSKRTPKNIHGNVSFDCIVISEI